MQEPGDAKHCKSGQGQDFNISWDGKILEDSEHENDVI